MVRCVAGREQEGASSPTPRVRSTGRSRSVHKVTGGPREAVGSGSTRGLTTRELGRRARGLDTRGLELQR